MESIEIYNKKKQRIKVLDLIIIIIVSLVTVHSVFPPLKIITGNNILFVTILMIMWVIITFLKTPSFYLSPTSHRLIIFVFFVYSITIPYILGNPTIGNRYLGIAPAYLLYIVFEYNRKYRAYDNNALILKITIFFSTISLFFTGKALLNNPFVSRSMSTNENLISLMKQGIGGYDLIYYLTLLVPVIMFLLMNNTILFKNRKVILFVYIICVFSVIIMSNFFTAFVVSITTSALSISIKKGKERNILFFTILLIIIIISSIVFLFIGDKIIIEVLNFLLRISDNSSNAIKINEMKNSILNSNNLEIYNVRWELMKVSIKTFINNPILGTSGNSSIDTFSFFSVTGQHSQILDTFAMLGFLPGSIFVYIIFKPYLVMFKCSVGKELVIPVLYSLLLLYMFNVLTISMGVVVNFIVPTIYYKYYDKIKEGSYNAPIG